MIYIGNIIIWQKPIGKYYYPVTIKSIFWGGFMHPATIWYKIWLKIKFFITRFLVWTDRK